MDKRAKDKLVRSPRENGGGQDAQKEVEGTRRRGRPRKRQKKEVERDLQVLGVRWRELVADRKKWKDIVLQAKAHSGLQCQCKKKKKMAVLHIRQLLLLSTSLPIPFLLTFVIFNTRQSQKLAQTHKIRMNNEVIS